MPISPQPPLEARVLPDEPVNRVAWQRWLAAGSLFIAFVACFALALGGLATLLKRDAKTDAGPRGSLILHWETDGERLAAVKAALDADDSGAAGPEIRDLTRLFARVTASVNPDIPYTANELLDLDALADRIMRHPLLVGKPIERVRVRRQLEYDLKNLPRWTELKVVHIPRWNANELIVYTVASLENQELTPVRWWLTRHGRTWRICDWEQIDLGYSEAARRALAQLSIDGGLGTTFHKAISAINTAKYGPQADYGPASVQQLLMAQDLEVPAGGYDLVQLELASVWQKCSRPDQVIAACERVKDPKAHPAVHYLRALAHAERQQHALVAQAAELYRQAAGRHPHLLEVEAVALEALSRTADAARCWSERLELLPEDTAALAEFCRLAPAGSDARIARAVERARKPIEFAMSVAAVAMQRQDEATFSAMERFLRGKSPAGPENELLAGMREEHWGDYERAAGHYLAAWVRATRVNERRELFDRYLDAMARCDRAAEAYAAAENPAAAFAHLTRGLEGAEWPTTLDDLPALLAAHRRRMTEDIKLSFYEGMLAIADGDYAAAEKKLLAAQASANDDEFRNRIRSQWLELYYCQGRMGDAYRRLREPNQSAFFELASICENDRNWDSLAELIALHRKSNGSDPWIEYFIAVREQALGNLPAALAAARKADPGTDDWLRSKLGDLTYRLAIKLEGVEPTYQSSSDKRAAFRRLIPLLAEEEDWDGVLELTALHSTPNVPRRSTTLYWAAKAHYQRGEYQAAIDTLTPWPYESLGRLNGAQLTELCDMVVRSALRLGQLEMAKDAAQRARDEYGLELPQVAVANASGDQAELRTLLEQRRIAAALFQQQLHGDAELATLLSNPEIADVRRWHGLAWPDDEANVRLSAVLLLPNPIAVQKLRSVAAAALSTSGAANEVAVAGQQSWLWNLNGAAVVLTAGGSSYRGCDSIPASWKPDDARRKLLEEHGAWIAIDLLQSDLPQPGSLFQQAVGQAIAAVARAANAKGIYYTVRPRNLAQLAMLTEDAIDKIEAGEFFKSGQLSQPIGEPSFAAPIPPDHRLTARIRVLRSLRKLADGSRVAKDYGHAVVRVRAARGHAAEDLWLKVIRSRRNESDVEEFLAEITQASHIWPHLQPGERVYIRYDDPLEVHERF